MRSLISFWLLLFGAWIGQVDATPRSGSNSASEIALTFQDSGKKETPKSSGKKETANDKYKAPKGIPEKVMKVLEYIDREDEAMDGYEGGRHFGNFEKRLPMTDKNGKRIKYREWDVNPLRKGVNRGAERLVTGSDGSAYYTDDHYDSFKKIR